MSPSPTVLFNIFANTIWSELQNSLQFVGVTGADNLEDETGVILKLKSNRMKTRTNKFCNAFVSHMGEGRGVHRVLVGKPEGKRTLGRPRRRWEDNIKMDLQKVGGGCGDWMVLAQDRDRWRALVSTVMSFRVPKMRGISWLVTEPIRFSRRTLLHGVSK